MNALVPRAQSALSRTRAANINVMQSSSDGIAADIRVFRIDPRVVLYVVRVASTTLALTARLIGIRSNGEALDLGGLSVAPASIGSARLAVPQHCAEECVTIHLEIRTDSSLMRLEAPQPPILRRKKTSWIVATAAAIAIPSVCAAFLAFERSHPAPLHAAPVVPVRLATAPLTPQIVSLSVRRDRGPDGDSVLASYLAVGDGGSFALVGPGGKIVARSAFARAGTTRLAVPAPYRAAALFARLTVTRDGKAAFASVALAPLVRATAVSNAPPTTSVSDLMSIDGPAVAGDSLNVRIDGNLVSPHIELQGETGNAIAARDLSPGTTRAAIPLPAAAAPQTYYVVLRYMRNGAEETVVRSIVASSRS
jgi:hypothetical protein